MEEGDEDILKAHTVDYIGFSYYSSRTISRDPEILGKMTAGNVFPSVKNPLVVMGRGLAFKKRPGDQVDTGLVEKTFVLEGEGVIAYYEDIAKGVSESESFDKVRKTYGWDEQYMGSEEFKFFLDEQAEDLAKVLDELGFKRD